MRSGSGSGGNLQREKIKDYQVILMTLNNSSSIWTTITGNAIKDHLHVTEVGLSLWLHETPLSI